MCNINWHHGAADPTHATPATARIWLLAAIALNCIGARTHGRGDDDYIGAAEALVPCLVNTHMGVGTTCTANEYVRMIL